MKTVMGFMGYRDWSIKMKLLLMTGMLILGSVFLESYLSYTQYTKDFERQSSEKVQQIIEQVSFNIETYLDELYRLTLFPYRNSTIMASLEEGSPDTELGQLEKRRLIESFLDDMMIYPRKDILRVSIMTDQIYSSARLPTKIVPDDNPETYDWYKRALKTQEYIFVPNDMQPKTNDKVSVFSIVKQLRSIRNTQQIIGVIKADANYDGIVEICDKATMTEDGGLYLLDDRNLSIYSTHSRFQKLAVNAVEPGSRIVDGYLINTATIPKLGWKVVAVNSVSEMNSEALKTRNTAFLFAFASCLFALFVLVLIIRRFLQPLLSIVRLMKEVERGRLDIHFQSARRDEIGYLGAAFNRLVSKISDMLSANTELVKEVYETKLLQKEAHISALYSQIRPHFLFNTLNLISLSMQSGRTEQAIDHINRLSSIMRSMTQGDKDVTLQREIDLLHAYLGIQCSRYEGRLAYSIDIDVSLYAMRIPSFMLQPIVENSIHHGCEKKKEKTSIAIRSERKGDRLWLIVEDDGIGMDAPTLGLLQSKVNASEESADAASATHTGIGLVNVNKRIKARYGSVYGLAIRSELGKGTVVTISLPYDPS
ncbi:sensor histidine kinase [Cohnella suwonensis]|uniref:histidine kinase n=1 Tax=Cohnella suwonensis TaxID=696072 RepID=A0ABW0LWJ8_9BACL